MRSERLRPTISTTSSRPAAKSGRGDVRRARAVFGVAALAFVAVAAAPAGALERLIDVRLDEAKLLKYPPNTETIIVGNPVVADVTMLKNSGTVVLTGRGYGDTNLVFLDRGGAVLSEADLRVGPGPGTLTVQRGAERETFTCHPRCEPTVTLGDSTAFMRDAVNSITLRNGLAQPSSSPQH